MSPMIQLKSCDVRKQDIRFKSRFVSMYLTGAENQNNAFLANLFLLMSPNSVPKKLSR